MDFVAALEAIIKSIPEFMRYFAPGYIFLYCYNYAGSRKREDRTEYLIIGCIALSFVLSTVGDIIVAFIQQVRQLYSSKGTSALVGLRKDSLLFRFLLMPRKNELIKAAVYWASLFNSQAWTVIISVCSGLIAGILRKSTWINAVSKVLFHRDFRDDMFVDLGEKMASKKNAVLVVNIKRKGDPYIYSGQVKKIYNAIYAPVLILQMYEVYDEKDLYSKKIRNKGQGKGQKAKKKANNLGKPCPVRRGGELDMVIHYHEIEKLEYNVRFEKYCWEKAWDWLKQLLSEKFFNPLKDTFVKNGHKYARICLSQGKMIFSKKKNT